MDSSDIVECRDEGRKAFLSNPYDINQNPHSLLGDEEESEQRRQWQYGWEDAHTDAERNEE